MCADVKCVNDPNNPKIDIQADVLYVSRAHANEVENEKETNDENTSTMAKMMLTLIGNKYTCPNQNSDYKDSTNTMK